MRVDGVYIYAPCDPLRLAFTVAYSRLGDTNHWLAPRSAGTWSVALRPGGPWAI